MRPIAQLLPGARPNATTVEDVAHKPLTVEPKEAPSQLDVLGQEHARARAALMEHGFVQFYPLLASLVGSNPKAALMLGHALYWTRTYLVKKPERDGWFYKTASEWREATGLTQREQESARDVLRKTGFWSEQLAGAPAKLYFRINLTELGRLAAQQAQTQFDGWTWKDELVSMLMGSPIMYFRPLADLSGGVISGLLLSHILGQQRQALLDGKATPTGWFPINVQSDAQTLCLGPKAHRNARDALRSAGFVQEAWTQEKRPTLMANVNLQAIVACVAGQAEPSINTPGGRKARKKALATPSAAPSLPAMPDRAQIVSQKGNVTHLVRLMGVGSDPTTKAQPLQGLPFCRNSNGATAHNGAAVVTTNQALSDSKGCPFVEAETVKGGPFVEAQVALLSKLYIQREITKPTPMRERAHTRDGDERAGARSSSSLNLPFDEERPAASPAPELVMPSKLEAHLHERALTIVASLAHQTKQLVLDELEGHLSSPRKQVHNPLGLLHAMATKAAGGSFIPTLADEVQRTRVAQARVQQAISAASTAHSLASTEAPAGSDPTRVAEAVERLKQQRDALLGRGGERGASQ